MIPGLYSAATAMDAATRRHEITSENLSNAQMPGFRRRIMTQVAFEQMLQSPRDNSRGPQLLGTMVGNPICDFHQGQIEHTTRPLDVAISGPGFFSVQGPSGTLYTRNGSFYVNGRGELTTSDDLPVQGSEGTILFPPDASTESVHISSDGRLYAGDEEFGQLMIVDFTDTKDLEPAGSSLFSFNGTEPPVRVETEVRQGHIERSNTSTIDEMIHLIESSRHFEAAQKALTTLSESIQKRIGLT